MKTFIYVVTHPLTMHIEKRTIKKNVKYYLAHSFREGNKVHKIRKYLGQNLEKQKLAERKELAKKLIEEEIKRYKIIHESLRFCI